MGFECVLVKVNRMFGYLKFLCIFDGECFVMCNYIVCVYCLVKDGVGVEIDVDFVLYGFVVDGMVGFVLWWVEICCLGEYVFIIDEGFVFNL